MFCPSVATSLGSAIFLQVFLAGSIGCDLFSLFWNRNNNEHRASVGASGKHERFSSFFPLMLFLCHLAPIFPHRLKLTLADIHNLPLQVPSVPSCPSLPV